VPDGQASALRACRNEKPRGVVYLLPSLRSSRESPGWAIRP